MADDEKLPVGEREWTEVRVQGEPGHGFAAYDFTFRTDTDAWKHMERIAEHAQRDWTNGRVRTRRVRQVTEVTEWQEVSPWTGG